MDTRPQRPAKPRRIRGTDHYGQGGPQVFFGDIAFYSGEWDARDRVGHIDTNRCRLFMLTGEYDYSCTVELSEATAAKIPGVRFQPMQGIGHFPFAENPKRFAAFIDALFQKDWVVYAKSAFGGPAQVLHYLGRYTHRVAISNHRLLAFDGESVSFRWKDYAHGNKQRKMTLAASDFLRRFTQHILPRGFVRIRQFGYLANTHRSARLALARQLLAAAPPEEQSPPDMADTSTYRCPHCDAEMRIGPNLSARQLAAPCRPLDSS